jgi:hypothetical protein
MKNNKWIRVTLTIILTLIVLIGVSGISFRAGMAQAEKFQRTAPRGSSQFPPPGNFRGFQNNFNGQPGSNPHMMQGFDHNGGQRWMGGFGNNSDPRQMWGFSHNGYRRDGSGEEFPHITGLLQLLVLGLLLWGGYTLYKKSGWKFVKVVNPNEAAPAIVKPATKKNK